MGLGEGMGYQSCLPSLPCLTVTVTVMRKRQELATASIFGGEPPPGAPERFRLTAATAQELASRAQPRSAGSATACLEGIAEVPRGGQ